MISVLQNQAIPTGRLGRSEMGELDAPIQIDEMKSKTLPHMHSEVS